jgi:hypothetical protein
MLKNSSIAVMLSAVLAISAFVPITHAQLGYGGEKVTVCKKTSSQVRPYVKVTVPEHVAEQFLDKGGVLPDSQGNCPEGISIRELVASRLQEIFSRIFSRLALR